MLQWSVVPEAEIQHTLYKLMSLTDTYCNYMEDVLCPGTIGFLKALLADSSIFTDFPLGWLKTLGILTSAPNPYQGDGLTMALISTLHSSSGESEDIATSTPLAFSLATFNTGSSFCFQTLINDWNKRAWECCTCLNCFEYLFLSYSLPK